MHDHKIRRTVAAALLWTVFVFGSSVGDAAATANARTPGALLRRSMIWCPDSVAKSVGFHKTFFIPGAPRPATIFIFADARYVLWINGRYVGRGPCRFDPLRPECDSVNVASFLHPGRNTLAVHVYGNISNGKTKLHHPGLAVRLGGKGWEIGTDTSWRCSAHTRFQDPTVTWADVCDNVDATREDGDFTSAGFDDRQWDHALVMDGKHWGMFHHRMTPRLLEKRVDSLHVGHVLPYDLPPGRLRVTMPRCLLGYVVLDFDADSGSVLEVGGRHTYVARAGRQRYMTLDSFGMSSPDTPGIGFFDVDLKAGRVRLLQIEAYNLVYPFARVASFTSSDSYLNRLWDVATWSVMQNSEDGYVDCPWERAEWMGDAAVVEYPITRACYAGPGADGHPLYGDPRLFGSLLRHIALSALPDGRVKAHAPSDRFDIHGYIEDYSCLWVQGVRQYFKRTHDTAFVADLWPAILSQMQWFLDHRTTDGLVKAREFTIFDNPLLYKVCEGATLNAFVYRALRDAETLAEVLRQPDAKAVFQSGADSLFEAYNQLLWNGETYNASTVDTPTVHAAVLALDRGIVSQERMPGVRRWLLGHFEHGSIRWSYTHFWLFNELYKMDSDAADSIVLARIRTLWNNVWNARNPGFVTSESMNGGRNYHNFGAVPAYFLTSYVLGVRADVSSDQKRILVEPRLGDLNSVKGSAVTPWGVVEADWDRTSGNSSLRFSFGLPRGSTGEIHIPFSGAKPTLTFDEVVLVADGICMDKAVSIHGRFVRIDGVPSGVHHGVLLVETGSR